MEHLIREILRDKLGTEYELHDIQGLSGGCINNGLCLSTNHGKYFMKWSKSTYLDMFEKEVLGLELLSEKGEIRIPKPVGTGSIEDISYLIMEYLETGTMSSNYWKDFGKKLAIQHGVRQSKFGLFHHNYIGRLKQENDENVKWVEFFINKRIKPQLKLAKSAGSISSGLIDSFERLYLKLPDILPEEPPALLHGDLWSGNVITGPDGQVSLIDPAVYFGHREMDIAFTRLFGGFDKHFYSSYHEEFPLVSGFEERVDIHNLYPLMVHVNLFGGSYLNSVEMILRRLV